MAAEQQAPEQVPAAFRQVQPQPHGLQVEVGIPVDAVGLALGQEVVVRVRPEAISLRGGRLPHQQRHVRRGAERRAVPRPLGHPEAVHGFEDETLGVVERDGGPEIGPELGAAAGEREEEALGVGHAVADERPQQQPRLAEDERQEEAGEERRAPARRGDPAQHGQQGAGGHHGERRIDRVQIPVMMGPRDREEDQRNGDPQGEQRSHPEPPAPQDRPQPAPARGAGREEPAEDQQRPGGEAVEQRHHIAQGVGPPLVDLPQGAGQQVLPHHPLQEVGGAVGVPAGQGPGPDHRQEQGRSRQAGRGPEPAPGARPGKIEERHEEDRQDGEALEQEPRREQRREADHPAGGIREARDQGDREHQQEGERRVEVPTARAVMAEEAEGGGHHQPGGQRRPPVEIPPAEGHGERHGAEGEERRRQAQGERRDAEEIEGERDQPVAQRRLQIPVLGHPPVGGDHERAALHHLIGRDPVARLVGVVDPGLA